VLNSALSGRAAIKSVRAGRTMSGSMRSSYVSKRNPIAAMKRIIRSARPEREALAERSYDTRVRKIDAFNHFFPAPFYERMLKLAGGQKDMGKRVRGVGLLHDLDARLRVMDAFGDGYQQILSMPSPPLESFAG